MKLELNSNQVINKACIKHGFVVSLHLVVLKEEIKYFFVTDYSDKRCSLIMKIHFKHELH